MGSIFGLGLAYAGQKKEEVLEMLMPVVADNDTPLEIVAIASLSLGLVYLGSCNEDVSQALMSVLMERPQATPTRPNPLPVSHENPMFITGAPTRAFILTR